MDIIRINIELMSLVKKIKIFINLSLAHGRGVSKKNIHSNNNVADNHWHYPVHPDINLEKFVS